MQTIGALLAESIQFEGDVESRQIFEPRRDELEVSLDWLAEGEGLSVFYFSGHGVRDRGQVSLAAADSVGSEPASMIAGADLAKRMRYSNCRQLLVLLDCCFAEALAVEIAGAVREGGPSVFALVAADVLTLAHADQSQDNVEEANSYRNLSPFTRALALALHGVGALSSNHAEFAELFELVSAESVRLGFPPPAMLRSGTAREPEIGFKLPQDPRSHGLSGWQFDWIASQQSSEEGRTIVLGTDGRRSMELAASLARTSSPQVLDARNAVTLGISRFRVRGQHAKGQVLVGVEDEDSINLVSQIDAHERRLVVIADPRLKSHLDGQVVQVPDIALADVLAIFPDGLSRSGLSALESSFEHIAAFSGDSLELAAISSWAATRFPGKVVDGSDLADRVRRVFEEETSAPHKKLALELLSFASGSYLPRRGFVGSLARLTGVAPQIVNAGLDELAIAGLIQANTDWIRAIAPRATSHREHLPAQFRALTEQTLNTSGVNGRLQMLVALAALAGRLARRGTIDDDTLCLLGDHGRELIDCGGPASVQQLLADVITLRNGDVPNEIYLHQGDALRLSDDYDGAVRTFEIARARAETPQSILRAEVGLISAGKNSRTDGNLLKQLHAELRPLPVGRSSIDPLDATSGRILAQALHHSGNLQYAVSDWNGALDSYSTAESILDRSVPSHAAILLDLWKGQADIYLHRGVVGEANRRLTDALHLVATSGAVFLDVRAHAKVLQFAGDCTRHASLHSQSGDSRLIEAAQWWYGRSARAYEKHGLMLGWLISRFRICQSEVVAGRVREAQFGFAQLWHDFAEIRNPLWEYKCAVMVCVVSTLLPGGALPSLAEAIQLVWDKTQQKSLSPYQSAWGELALASVDGGPIMDVAQVFDEIGATALSKLLSDGLDHRIGCFY